MADKVEVQFGAQLSGLTAGINQATEQIESLTAPVANIQTAFTGFAEAAGVAFAVDRVAAWAQNVAAGGEAVKKASQALGMTVEQTSRLNLTFQAMGIEESRATIGLERLAYNMNQAAISASGPAAHAFQALGISISDLKNMSLDQVMNRIADAFSKAADGPNKTAIAIALFGRSGAQMIPVLDKGSAGMAEFQQKVAATGAQLTGPMADGMEATALNFHLLDMSTQGLSNALFMQLKPAIDDIVTGATALNESVSGSEETMSGLATAVEVVVKTFTDLGDIIGIVVRAGELIEAQFEKLLGPIIGFIEGYQEATLAGKSFFDAISTGATHAADYFDQAVAKQTAALAKLKADFADIWNVPRPADYKSGEAVGEDGSGAGAPKPQMQSLGAQGSSRGAGNPAADMLQQWRDALDRRLMDEKSFFADSKGEELKYWQEKLALVNHGAQAMGLSDKQWAALHLQVERQVYALDKSAMQDWIRQYKAGIDEQLADLKTELSQKEISEAEYYARSKALAQDWANVVAEIYGKNTAQYGGALKQMDALDKQHAAQSEAVWKNASQIITNSFDQMLTGMLRGTQTFQQAFARLAENLVVAMLESIAKMTVNWALHQAQKLALTITTDTAITVADTTQAAASAAAQNAVDVKPSVMKHAGSAAAAVYDDVSQIPYVGWVLAPPAAAAAFAAVAAFGSFDVGAYALPSDMIIQAHQGEMILPAAQAAQVRAGQASVGAFPSGGVGGAGGGVTVVFAPNVQAWNGQDAANALKSQGRVIAQIVADHIKGGNTALRGAMSTAGG